MNLEIVTPPAAEPLTVAEAKAHLRVDHSTEDTLIGAYITAARQLAEAILGRQLITATRRIYLDEFPWDDACPILLPYPKIQAVSEVSYVDSAGDTQVWASSKYQVDAVAEPGRLVPAHGQQWPVTREQLNAVTITYTCGYGDDSTDIPENIRSAIRIITAELYKEREDSAPISLQRVPLSAKYLLTPDRVFSF